VQAVGQAQQVKEVMEETLQIGVLVVAVRVVLVQTMA
jgi:hypothetical protein